MKKNLKPKNNFFVMAPLIKVTLKYLTIDPKQRPLCQAETY
jgi:hypothetical protein